MGLVADSLVHYHYYLIVFGVTVIVVVNGGNPATPTVGMLLLLALAHLMMLMMVLMLLLKVHVRVVFSCDLFFLLVGFLLALYRCIPPICDLLTLTQLVELQRAAI